MHFTSQTQYQQPGQNLNLGLSNGVEEGNYIAPSPSGMGICSQEMVPKIVSPTEGEQKIPHTDRTAGMLRDFTSYLRIQTLSIFPWSPNPCFWDRNQLSSPCLPRDRIHQERKQWPTASHSRLVTTEDWPHQQTDRADSVHTPGQTFATHYYLLV